MLKYFRAITTEVITMSTEPMRSAYLYQRISSEQQKGNSSLFRQTEAQDAWLASNPDVKVQSKLVDEGLSGYKGEHLTKGSLGKLVTLIEAGSIPKGSLILVEHFSRLSRQNIDKAEELLRTIWSAGITIITVRCGSEYPPESINDMAIRIKLIVEIESAYKDSKWRSDKAKASHAKKRIEASQGITPKVRTPFWLDKKGNCNEYGIVIKDMFDLYLSGKGQALILRDLQHKYPQCKAIQKMQQTTVIRSITNENCAGLWCGYKVFEPVVSDKIFYEAQRVHKERLFKNVQPDRQWPLSGLIECGHCGKGMSIQQTSDRLPLLRCSNKQRLGKDRSGCDASATFPYAVADHYFSFYVFNQILNELTVKDKNKEANNKINELESKLSKEKIKFTKAKERYQQYDEQGDDIDMIFDLMQESSKKIKSMENNIREINAKNSSTSEFEISKDIFQLTNDPVAFNLALHKVGFKIILKNDQLSYKGVDTLKYQKYSRKDLRYYYTIGHTAGFLPKEGLTTESLLNKSQGINNQTSEHFDKLQDHYIASVEHLKNGKEVSFADIFKFAV
jgi:hypothetical protein